MAETIHSSTSISGPAKDPGPRLAETLLRIAWLAILLGLGIEAILLILAAGFGGIPGIQPIVADLVQKVSWSVIVCAGLAFGKAASKGQPAWMGFAGLFSAPVAFSVAGTLHRSASYALKLAEPGSGAAFPFLIAALKGLEYAALGLILGWVGKRARAGAAAYAAAGFVIGLVFGTAIVWSSASGSLISLKVLPRLINEVLFPLGCSLALFAADAIGERTGK